MPNIYELSEQYKTFLDYANNALDNDELSEEDIQTLLDTLESVQEPLENKLENTIRYLKNLEGDIAAYKLEESRIAKKRKTAENTYDRLKQWMRDSLEINGIEKVNAGMFKVRLQANPASVNIVDVTKIPNSYKIPQEPKVDTKALLIDLKDGLVVNGAELVTGKKHIRFS